jgi:hypothetical protein
MRNAQFAIKMSTFTRRDFLKLGVTAVAGVLGAGAMVAAADESQEPVVERIQISIPALPAGLEGLRIAHLSDFHLYPFTRLSLIRRCVAMTNALAPDLIVLGGDYVWRDLDAIHDLAPELGKLNARHGVFAIIGNHDIWLDAEVIKQALRQAGLNLLVNAGIPITAGGGALWLAGLDDGWSGRPDLDAALEQKPAGAPAVLALHEPDLADEYALDGRIAFQFSGHSHGGQVRRPLRGAFILPYLGQKYDMGLYRVRAMWLYTNRGIGCISEPLRYNCAPEITEFTLILP